MHAYLLILRLVHILCGVFWAGAALAMAGFVLPSLAAIGPHGSRFVERFVGKSGFPIAMTVASVLTTVSGGLLYWQVSGHLSGDWTRSPVGATLTWGAIAGIIAFVFGITFQKSVTTRLSRLGRQVAAAGAPPTPEQAQAIQSLSERLAFGATVAAVLLVLAVAGMALARYMY